MRETILVRHGQSRYNLKLTTSLDSELTDEGVRQVQETAKYLRSHFGDMSHFVGRVSPYHRCLQTAHIIHEETGIEFWVEPGPREIMTCYELCVVPKRHEDYGHFDWLNGVHKFSELDADRGVYGDEGWTFHRETEEDFTRRLTAYFEFLAQYEKVLVVSHGTPATALAYMATGKYEGPSVTKYVANSSLSYIRDGELVWFNKVVYSEDPEVYGDHNPGVVV